MNQRFQTLKSSFGHSIVTNKSSLSNYSQLINDSKYCIVALETTYRDALELNTTYLLGKTFEGETMLLPKQLIEQADSFSMNENPQPSDHDEHTPISMSEILKTTYSSHGNVVRCVTGSFN